MERKYEDTYIDKTIMEDKRLFEIFIFGFNAKFNMQQNLFCNKIYFVFHVMREKLPYLC